MLLGNVCMKVLYIHTQTHTLYKQKGGQKDDVMLQ